MSIKAIIETKDGDVLNDRTYHSGSAYCYLDEYNKRLLLARPNYDYEQGVVVHAMDDFEIEPEDVTLIDLKKISVPETIIAEIMPWSRQTFDVHERNGEELFLTLVSLPLVQIIPVREATFD